MILSDSKQLNLFYVEPKRNLMESHKLDDCAGKANMMSWNHIPRQRNYLPHDDSPCMNSLVYAKIFFLKKKKHFLSLRMNFLI